MTRRTLGKSVFSFNGLTIGSKYFIDAIGGLNLNEFNALPLNVKALPEDMLSNFESTVTVSPALKGRDFGQRKR